LLLTPHEQLVETCTWVSERHMGQKIAVL